MPADLWAPLAVAVAMILVFLAASARQRARHQGETEPPNVAPPPPAAAEPATSLLPASPPSIDPPPPEEAATREPDATVIVMCDDWSTLAIDGLAEAWGRIVDGAPTGFSELSAGRHSLATSVDGARVAMEFIAFPGEQIVCSLQQRPARWVGLPVDSVTVDEAKLVRSRAALGLARAVAHVSGRDPEELVARVVSALTQFIGRPTSDSVLTDTESLGQELVGVPLTRAQIDRIVRVADDSARVSLGRGDAVRAGYILHLGLLLLPEEPRLLARLGESLLARGDARGSKDALQAALLRPIAFDPVSRAHAASVLVMATERAAEEASAPP